MADDLALLTEAALAAGAIARRYFRRDPKTWHKPDHAGPVTEADLEVDAMLRERLMAARPGYGWLSEETPDGPERLQAQRVFVVDPLDGTRAFIGGDPGWAHALAVVENGTVTAGVVYLPEKDRLYAAGRGLGATLNGSAISVSNRDALTGATLLAPRPTFDPWHWAGAEVPRAERHFRASLAYRLSLVAEGRFDAMLTLRPTWEWDVAAGSLIVEEAGGRVTDRRGAPAAFNAASPQINGLVAAGPRLHEEIIGRLS